MGAPHLAKEERRYIAWDGEGETRDDGSHVYFLLACKPGLDLDVAYIYDHEGLSTADCLNFFWSVSRQFRKSWNVIYGGSYDVNNIVRDLSRAEAYILYRDQLPVLHGPFEIDYQAGVFGVRHRMFARRVPLWDVVKFYQSTFVKAIRDNLPDFDAAKLEEIEEQKSRRAKFQAQDIAKVVHYTALELEALLMLMHKLDADLIEAGIGRLRSLHGAGSIAGALMNKFRVGAHMDRTGYEFPVIPE